jgi:hypothetical protein
MALAAHIPEHLCSSPRTVVSWFGGNNSILLGGKGKGSRRTKTNKMLKKALGGFLL